MLGLKRGVVYLADHDALWAAEAELSIRSLLCIFGEMAIAAEHVGSTSIPGIKAKPIIDIAVGVKDLAAVLDKEEALEQEGFIHRSQNDNEWQVFFCCNGEDDTVTHHIHVVKYDGKAWNGFLTFRDRLRKNRGEALAYEALKLELMEKFKEDRTGYTEAKAEFILEIINKGVSER